MIEKASLGAWVEFYKVPDQQEIEHCGKSTSLAIISGFDYSFTAY